MVGATFFGKLVKVNSLSLTEYVCYFLNVRRISIKLYFGIMLLGTSEGGLTSKSSTRISPSLPGDSFLLEEKCSSDDK